MSMCRAVKSCKLRPVTKALLLDLGRVHSVSEFPKYLLSPTSTAIYTPKEYIEKCKMTVNAASSADATAPSASAVVTPKMEPTSATPVVEKDTYISMPTNNCGRVLLFLRMMGLTDDVYIVVSPAHYGGMKTPEFR